METNYFKKHEEFRVVMLQTLDITFPKIVWRQVVQFLGNKQARTLFDLMKSSNFYLFFMVNPVLPEDVKSDYEDLFENPYLFKVMNAFRVAKIKSYLEMKNLSSRLRDFLEALLCYLKASGSNCGCCCDNFIRAKEHFKQAESRLVRGLKSLSVEERDLLTIVTVLVVEEFDETSFSKILEMNGLNI